MLTTLRKTRAAVQMSNLTSFSGTWMVSFAEHEPQPGAKRQRYTAPGSDTQTRPQIIADVATEKVGGIVGSGLQSAMTEASAGSYYGASTTASAAARKRLCQNGS